MQHIICGQTRGCAPLLLYAILISSAPISLLTHTDSTAFTWSMGLTDVTHDDCHDDELKKQKSETRLAELVQQILPALAPAAPHGRRQHHVGRRNKLCV